MRSYSLLSGKTIIRLSAIVLSGFPLFIYGQLCTGSLGDPIVNIDFGSGTATHGGALASGTTTYTYTSADFPNDGYYTITNSTAGSGSVWWSATDHTGNAGGYMMVVNASISTTDYFYKRTITGLCPGTTYEFAAWVMNLLRSQDNSPPNITFSIETTGGTVINSYTTGSIPLAGSPTWHQYGFYFTTPANTSTVIIRMRNNSAGGAPANDLALDDITFRPCGPDMSATINNATSYTVCAGMGATFTLQGSMGTGYSNPDYQWQINTGSGWVDIPGATTLAYTYSLPAGAAGSNTQFRLAGAEGGNISSLNCRVYSNAITLNVESAPVAEYTISSLTCKGQSIEFTDHSTADAPLTYYWNFGDGQTSTATNPTHIYTQTGSYTTGLIVISANGCIDTADSYLTVNVYDTPHAAFTVTPIDTTIFEPGVTLTDLSTGGIDCMIYWDDGDSSDCGYTLHTYKKSGIYQITEVVTNEYGCTDTTVVTIIKEPEFRIYIPNAFTPNGDGINDNFKPGGLGFADYTFRIYTRWGQKIFETNDPDNSWDGSYESEQQQEGVYVYDISFYDEVDLLWHEYRGMVSLLR